VRSTVGALGAANQQLGNVQGLLSTTMTGLNDVSNTMASMRNVDAECELEISLAYSQADAIIEGGLL